MIWGHKTCYQWDSREFGFWEQIGGKSFIFIFMDSFTPGFWCKHIRFKYTIIPSLLQFSGMHVAQMLNQIHCSHVSYFFRRLSTMRQVLVRTRLSHQPDHHKRYHLTYPVHSQFLKNSYHTCLDFLDNFASLLPQADTFVLAIQLQISFTQNSQMFW